MLNRERTFTAEIANGLTLHKTEVDYTKNFEVVDQINTYTIESSLGKDAEITIDISGSEGAIFNGPQDAHSLHKTEKVGANETKEIG
jgi:hypothetical protein